MSRWRCGTDRLGKVTQRPDVGEPGLVGAAIRLLELARLLGCQPAARLAHGRVDEQAAAHPDSTVDPPDRQIDTRVRQHLLPGQDVLVNGIDKGPVEVEQQGGPGLDLTHLFSIVTGRCTFGR